MSSGMVIFDDQLAQINTLIGRLLKEADAKCALLLSRDGRSIAKQGFTRTMNTDQLGALVAGAYSATKGVAEIIGEPEFSVMFHQGKHEHINIMLVDPKTLLVVSFDDRTTVGMVRLVSKALSERLSEIMGQIYENPTEEEELGSLDEIDGSLDDVFGKI
jgi:predicted regulator of Ras-like GTPase activity (Roadblock/LC7/MglB family)